jgi:hypothetical protein
MLKLLDRNIAAVGNRLLMLAPPQALANPHFENVDIDPGLHRHLVRSMQRLRGRVYLEDGAVSERELSADGRHQTPEDDRSWHLLLLDAEQRVTACVWYMDHDNTTTLDRLRVRSCPLTTSDRLSHRFRAAIDGELARARRDGLRYAELGGWAVSRETRNSADGLILALSGYSLGRIGGGTLGLTTATVRHASATILRRLGGAPLEVLGAEIPAYYDPRYECEMQLLRFDSRRPNPRYSEMIDSLAERMAFVPVVASTPLAEPVVYADNVSESRPQVAA